MSYLEYLPDVFLPCMCQGVGPACGSHLKGSTPALTATDEESSTLTEPPTPSALALESY
jgi:hypothetical protein